MNAKECNRRSRSGQAAASKLEPSLRDKYEASLRANAKRIAKAYRDTGIVAAGKVPTLDEVLRDAALSASVTARTKVERQRIAEAAAHPIISDMGKQALRALLEPIVAAQAGVQAERIVAGVRDRVAAIMLDALTEGLSVPETARILQAQLELDAAWQAEMLARTDLISLSNAGSHKAAVELDDGPKFKVWLSAGDDRVRPTHVDANGQVVAIDSPYKLSEGVELQYPGDPAGPDGEVINCRCVSVFTDTDSATLAHSDAGGIHDEPVTQFDAPVTAAGFDESKHPRYESGRREGGRFAPKDGTSSADAQAEAEDAVAVAQESDDLAAYGRQIVAEREAEKKRQDSALVEPMTVEQMNAFELVNGDAYKLGKMGNVELEQYRQYVQAQADRNYGGAGDLYQEEADLAALTQKQRGADVVYYEGLKDQVRPGEVGAVRRMDLNSTNPVYVGKLDGKSVVVKPEMQLSATRLRTWVEPGFDLEREQAAAHVAGLLREVDPLVAPIVPAYRVMDVEGYGRSGVSDYLPGGETMAEAHKGNRVGAGGRREKIDEGIPRIRLFDGIVGNTDRHEANMMFNIDNDLVAIDHGLAFPSSNQEDWPSLQRGALTTSLEPAQRSALEQLRQKLKADPVLPTLLTEKQVQAMDDRIAFMLANDRLPTTDDWQKGWGNT